MYMYYVHLGLMLTNSHVISDSISAEAYERFWAIVIRGIEIEEQEDHDGPTKTAITIGIFRGVYRIIPPNEFLQLKTFHV